MTTFTTDQWIILGLVFILGLLIGMWLTSGGRRKWKARYNEELEQRRRIERERDEREKHWAGQEKEWRERDSLRGAALRDQDRDGVPDRDDRRPADDRRY